MSTLYDENDIAKRGKNDATMVFVHKIARNN